MKGVVMDFSAADEAEMRLNMRLQELGEQILALRTKPVRPSQPAFVLIIQDGNTTVYGYRSYELAWQGLVRYARREYQPLVRLGVVAPDDDGQVVQSYFDWVQQMRRPDAIWRIEQVHEGEEPAAE